MNTDARFDVESHFDESWAAAYEKQIRQFCPAYDALHRMLPGWFSGMPEKARFLSAGSGSGAELLALGAAYPGAELHGVDLSADVLSVCQDRLQTAGLAERVHLHLGKMQTYRPAELFDGASSVFVAHFIHEPEERLAYFRAVAGCLKNGATFVFADLFGDKAGPGFRLVFENWLRFYAAQGIAADQLVQDRAHIESGICFEPEANIENLLVEAGFEPPVRFFQSYLFGGWVTRKAA